MRNVVSLFSGAGGFDLGFHQTGAYKTTLANELLDIASTTFVSNFVLPPPYRAPAQPVESELPLMVCGDVAELCFELLASSDFSVLIGGPPCQDFSMAHNDRGGLETKRGKLYRHFVRAIEELNPKTFIFENVPGLLSTHGGADIQTIREDLSERYDLVHDGLVDCINLGIPQTRRRLIIVGLRKGEKQKKALQEDLEKTLTGKKWIFRKYPLTPIEVFTGKKLTQLNKQYKNILEQYSNIELITEFQKTWMEKYWNILEKDITKDYCLVNKIEHNKKEFSQAMREHEQLLEELGYLGYPVDYRNPVPRESSSVLDRLQHTLPGANSEFVKNTEWQVKAYASNIYRRAFPLKPAPTVLAKGGGGTWGYHYDFCRGKFSNKERARIQTFPDPEFFKFVGDEQAVRSQIGEAVPPLLSKRLAQSLLKYI